MSSDVNKVPVILNSLQASRREGVMAPLLLPPEVYDHLFGLGGVKVQVPDKQSLISVGDQAYHHRVVCKINNNAGGVRDSCV